MGGRVYKHGMRGHKEKPGSVLQVGPARKTNRVPPPKPKQRYTKKQIIEALNAANGLKSAAARRLGCSRQGLDKYFRRYPELVQELEQIRESYIDLAESSLLEQIKKENTQATIFLLRCLGKGRGWVEDPKVQLHAHVDAGQGTWMEIMERAMAKQAEKERNTIDVVAEETLPGKMLMAAVGEANGKTDSE